MKVTIRDVARECNVSPFTVSSVINKKRAIKKETREKVLRTISRLGYDPAANVPHSRLTKTDTLGLVVPMERTKMAPFYFRAINAFKKECTDYNFDAVLYTQEDIKKKLESDPLGPGCAGLVVYCPIAVGKGLYRSLAARNIPVVLIRRQLPKGISGVVRITNDDEAGLRLALDHLREQGHRKIALMGINDDHSFLLKHKETYQQYHRSCGWPYHPDLVTGFFETDTPADGGPRRDRVDRWWHTVSDTDYRPTALICRDDHLAFMAIHRLERIGVRVPGDLSVVGYDDDYGDEGIPMPLTTVRIPVEEMIGMAVRTLDDNTRQGRKTAGMHIEMPLELVVRESTKRIIDN